VELRAAKIGAMELHTLEVDAGQVDGVNPDPSEVGASSVTLVDDQRERARDQRAGPIVSEPFHVVAGSRHQPAVTRRTRKPRSAIGIQHSCFTRPSVFAHEHHDASPIWLGTGGSHWLTDGSGLPFGPRSVCQLSVYMLRARSTAIFPAATPVVVTRNV